MMNLCSSTWGRPGTVVHFFFKGTFECSTYMFLMWFYYFHCRLWLLPKDSKVTWGVSQREGELVWLLYNDIIILLKVSETEAVPTCCTYWGTASIFWKDDSFGVSMKNRDRTPVDTEPSSITSGAGRPHRTHSYSRWVSVTCAGVSHTGHVPLNLILVFAV